MRKPTFDASQVSGNDRVNGSSAEACVLDSSHTHVEMVQYVSNDDEYFDADEDVHDYFDAEDGEISMQEIGFKANPEEEGRGFN